MANDAKKGITVKVDADLHAEVSRYLQEHGMTMTEFVTRAIEDELHPKIQEGEKIMANTRTIAFQVPEELFQRIKDYLQRNNITQRQFLIDLIEDELEREQSEFEDQGEDEYGDEDEDEDEAEGEDADFDESEGVSDAAEGEDEAEDESADFADSEGVSDEIGDSESEDESAEIDESEAVSGDAEGEDEAESEDEDEDEGFSMSM